MGLFKTIIVWGVFIFLAVAAFNYFMTIPGFKKVVDNLVDILKKNKKLEFKLDKNSACVSKKQGNVSGSLVGAVDCVRKDYCTSFPDRCKECEDAPMMDYFKPKRKKLFGGM